MTLKSRYSHILLLIILLLFLVACRKKEEEPTPIPTAVPVTVESAPDPTNTPPAKPTPEPVQPTRPALDIDWPPQLVFSSPAPGQETLLDGAITVRFDQPMDPDSVANALEVVQATSGAAISGALDWPRPDTLIFTPRSTLERKQTYRFRIGDTARGQNGQPLRETLNLELQTVGFLEVSQVIPGPGTEDIDTDAAVTVIFNRPVVPLVASGQQANLPQPLVLEPETAGQGEWISTSIYRFTPDEPLAGATNYQARIGSGLADITGGLLSESYIWSFRTISPDVVTFVPANLDSGISPTDPFTITFNMPMNRASTEAAITLSPSSSLNFVWSDDDRVVTVSHRDPLELSTTYELSVNSTAQAKTGAVGLPRTLRSVFETVPFPAVLQTFPASGELSERFQRGFSVRFASPMDLTTLEDKVLIEPEPERVRYFFNNFDNSLNLDFELERNSEYQVTIPATAADPYGNQLGQAYGWQFRTRGHAPMVSLNLPQQISQLSTSYPSQVDIIHRNVSRIDASLFDLGLPADLLMSPYEIEFTPLGGPVRTWSQPVENVPETADVAPLFLNDELPLPPGVYYLTVDAPELNTDDRFWQNQGNILVVGDTNLVVKEMFDQVHVWATDLATGLPVAGRDLGLYNRDGQFVGSAVTDDSGYGVFNYRPQEGYLSGVLVVSGLPGQSGFGAASSQWGQGISTWQFGLNSAGNDEPRRFAYLHTDRPIYRPGDTVQFRGIVRDANYGRYGPPTNDNVRLTMDFISNFEPTGYEFVTTLDESGEFRGEYVIPEDARLGTYRFMFATGDIEAQRDFAVAEYRKPEFQATATAERSQIVRGESVDVVVEASYFFGGPASDLALEWTAFADSFFLPWDGPYYSFGDGGDFFYEPGGLFGSGGNMFGQQLLRGEGRTDGSGQFVITLPADLLEDEEAGSRTITVEASIFDVTNFPITARATVVIHESEIYVGVIPERRVSTAGSIVGVDVITVDWEAQAAGNRPVDLTLFRREWEPIRDREFGIYFTQWEAIDTEIETMSLTTDDQGQGSANFALPEGGTYLVVATTADSAGREHTSSTIIWVADEAFVGWRTDPRERRMDLVPDQDEYEPGDVARVLVQSPFEEPVNAWLTIERGTLIEQRVIRLESSSEVLEIPLSGVFAPNVFLAIHAVKGTGQTERFADIRVGMTELVVSPEALELSVSLEPREGLLQPGETAIYDLSVADSTGRPVQANVSLSLVDLAVLTLKPDNAPPIEEAFYARQPIRSQTGSGLIISGEGLEIELPSEGAGLGGGGGGGIAAEAAQSFAIESEDDDVRSDFPDTAYWSPAIRTGADGRATVEVPLPDSVTTWRLSAKGVSLPGTVADTLVGQTEVDVVATLPLLIRPVTPRFFTVGDRLEIGAAVHNNTGEELEVEVTLEAIGLTLEGPIGQMVTVPSAGRQVVGWPVVVDDVSSADLTFRAQGGGFRDATKPTFGEPPDQRLPVVRFAGEDVVGTSGVLAEPGRRVEAILLPPDVDNRQ